MPILLRRALLALLAAGALAGLLLGAAAAQARVDARLGAASEQREQRRAERQAEREERQKAREERRLAREQSRAENNANARPDGIGRRRCTLTAAAEAQHILAGEEVLLSGSMQCPQGTEAGGRAVTVYRSGGGLPRETVATVTTEADGSYKAAVAGLAHNSMLAVRSPHTRGARVAVKVAPAVTLDDPAAGTQLATASSAARNGASRFVTFAGTAGADYAGTRVALQISYDPAEERWRTVAFGQVAAGGEYAVRHAFRTPGETWVRVVVRPRRGFAAAASAPLAYDVVGPQNPKLTIQASTALTSFGSPVAISGVGAPEESVELLARSAGGPFVSAGTAETDSSGGYSFSPSPLAGTWYEVRDAAAETSTALLVRVGFALSLEAPPAQTSAGTPLTLTGTVAPVPPGAEVRLERQNASGVGFHPIGAATVEGSAFSIVHSFAHAGSYVLRVRVPRVPPLQATASPSFDLQVLPAAGE